MNIKNFKWTREPQNYTMTDDKVEIITEPRTDLWQRTYYHFRNDSAPVLQIETEEQFFSFIVKTDFTESHHRFDQCGIALADEEMITVLNVPKMAYDLNK